MGPMLSMDRQKEDVSGWLMSEKYDGVRAYWDGVNFISRGGHVIQCPSKIREEMPRQQLDGELWMGRGKFQSILKIVRKSNPTVADWAGVRYMVFDCLLNNQAYAERIKSISPSGIAEAAMQIVCRDCDHAERFQKEVISLGGEGVIYRNPLSIYKNERSSDYLRWKPIFSAEAKVIGFATQMKCLLCEWDGKLFKMPLRGNSAAIGQLVTFTYLGLTDSGLPRTAEFCCVRDYE